ncbi:hypothetical protein D0A37_01410 [Microcoleus vaginatus HSN003]|nr:hypothetical protein D0A37_01410 [Microcoleus vaginatus HSN003]
MAAVVPVLVVTTSALGVRGVVTVASLFPGVGSAVVELLLAVLLTLPDGGAMKLTVLVTLPVLVKLTASKVTIPVAAS